MACDSIYCFTDYFKLKFMIYSIFEIISNEKQICPFLFSLNQISLTIVKIFIEKSD